MGRSFEYLCLQHALEISHIVGMKRKVELLQPLAAGKTLQPVLVVRERPSQDLIDQGYFYKIIEARDFL